MVDRINLAPPQVHSPLRNSSIGFIDDYESGMEASASSMAEEDEIDLEKEDMTQTQQQHHFTKKPTIIVDHKIAGSRGKSHTSHRRMSSGNSSTDSNATMPRPPTSAANTHTHQSTKRHLIPKGEFSSPLNVQTPASVRLLARKEDVPTPSSGYDGDTEGPSVEDIV